ncbi:MAG: hypothetical protein ACFFCW_00550 [Candidatus Hodarchaeota archaeon]
MMALRWSLRFIMLSFPITLSACQHVSLRSVYMDPPLYPVNAMRVMFDGKLGGEGSITFDGVNRCFMFDKFGDPGACNLALVYPIQVRLERLNIEDKTGKGRTVYQLIGDLPGENRSYYLVVPSKRNGPYRLVIDDGTPEVPGEIKKWGIVTLELVEER